MRKIVVIAMLLLVRDTIARGCSIPLRPTKTSFVTLVRVGSGGPFRFLFDTGTTQTVITPEVARWGSPAPEGEITAVTRTGPVKVERALLETVRAGDLTIPALTALVLPLPVFKSHGRIDGILGMDILAGRSFFIDVRRRCVDVDVEAVGGSTMEAVDVVGRVAMRVDGLNFILDSAASFAVLTSQRAASLAVIDGTTELTTASGSQVVQAGSIPRLRFGDVILRDIPATISLNDDAREDALLPVTLFSTIFVNAERTRVVLNGRQLLRDPHVLVIDR